MGSALIQNLTSRLTIKMSLMTYPFVSLTFSLVWYRLLITDKRLETFSVFLNEMLRNNLVSHSVNLSFLSDSQNFCSRAFHFSQFLLNFNLPAFHNQQQFYFEIVYINNFIISPFIKQPSLNDQRKKRRRCSNTMYCL